MRFVSSAISFRKEWHYRHRRGGAIFLRCVLDAVRLARDTADRWQRVDLRPVVAQRVRFGQLREGAYVLLLRGKAPGEQMATKVVIGGRDAKRIELRIEPLRVTGRVTLAELPLVGGSLELAQDESAGRRRGGRPARTARRSWRCRRASRRRCTSSRAAARSPRSDYLRLTYSPSYEPFHVLPSSVETSIFWRT
ncbi:MAG TPA: hypothetical protein VJ276_01550 [Thermoanaerobaculia bacterium]|nr:hypothetical protein [Thermoanaerobaculia bacterium]